MSILKKQHDLFSPLFGAITIMSGFTFFLASGQIWKAAIVLVLFVALLLLFIRRLVSEIVAAHQLQNLFGAGSGFYDPPERAEHFTLSDFHAYSKIASKISPGKYIGIVDLRCPQCKGIMPIPEHGQKAECKSCHLNMVVYGNSIYCWK